MTLLQDALKFKIKGVAKTITDEEVELGMAWLRGVVTVGQILKAMGKPVNHGNAVMYRVLFWIKEAYTRGILIENKDLVK